MNLSPTQFLERDGAVMSYEIAGEGPLVVCIPGMADLRGTFRFLAPALVEAGYRVAVVDLRGHGDSATTFPAYDNPANASDIEALVDHLGGPAVVVGNSMGAAIGVLIAANRPELVSGLVLVGPFVRNGRVSRALTAVMRVATSAPLLALTWKAYLPTLFAGTKPADFARYRAGLIDSIRHGHAAAVSKTMRTSHDPAEAALADVHTPVLVVMGELDPDFPSPKDEADWIVQQLGGSVLMVPDAGHYPHAQHPEVVVPAVTAFLETATRRA
jgi:pimeloyl-ACP methyl ester carboxylesterase